MMRILNVGSLVVSWHLLILLMVYNVSYSAYKWTWGYKYNHAGVREQKRMLISTHRDDAFSSGVNYKILAHLWEYYMTALLVRKLCSTRSFRQQEQLKRMQSVGVILGFIVTVLMMGNF
jgi:hypothetical protein